MNKRQLKKIKQFKIKSIKKINYSESDRLLFTVDKSLLEYQFEILVEDLKKVFKTKNIILLDSRLNFEKVIKN